MNNIVKVIIKKNCAVGAGGKYPGTTGTSYTHRTTATTEGLIQSNQQVASSSQTGNSVEVDLSKETFQSFLAECDEVLGLMNGSSKRVYDGSGTSINTIHELKMHETYYITEVSKMSI